MVRAGALRHVCISLALVHTSLFLWSKYPARLEEGNFRNISIEVGCVQFLGRREAEYGLRDGS